MVAVEVNGQRVSEGSLVLKQADGILLVPLNEARVWRIQLTNPQIRTYEGQDFLVLKAEKAMQATFDEARQVLTLQFDPSLLDPTVMEAQQLLQPMAEREGIAGFLNYDFNIEHTERSNGQGGALELGISNPYGLFTTAGIARNQMTRAGNDFQYARLYTTWLNDHPEDMTSILVGDNLSRPWQRGFGVRFAGIQYTRDFGTQPRFIRYPLQTVAGDVGTASALDVYVNGNLIDKRNVAAGPFELRDLPVTSGNGDIKIITTDMLGRRQEIVQPFYLARTMLREGLSDFTYEAGVLRRNYGTDSFAYGDPFGSALYRRGVTPWFTGEAHADVVRDEVATALGGSFLLGSLGVLDLAVGGSEGHEGQGGLVGGGFFRQAQLLSFGGSSVLATKNYTQLGIAEGLLPTKQLTDAFIGWNIGWGASLNVRYASAAYYDRPHVDVYALSFFQTLFESVSLNISAIHTRSTVDNTQISAIITIPIGERTYTSLAFRGSKRQNQPEQYEVVGQVAKNIGWGPDWGYRVTASSTDIQRGLLTLQSDYGQHNFEVVRDNNAWAERAFGSGGIGVIGGQPFLSRRIEDSFATIKVGDYAGIRVYADNQLIGKTDSDGTLLLPRLRAYDVNIIRVEADDLPMDAQIEKLEQPISPYFRSGLVIDFPIRRSHGVLMTIQLEDHTPMPAGASVTVMESNHQFPVGMDGEVYLTDITDDAKLSVSWGEQHCEIAIKFKKTTEPLPNIGTYICKGIRRN